MVTPFMAAIDTISDSKHVQDPCLGVMANETYHLQAYKNITPYR